MPDKLVTIAHKSSPLEAELLRTRLEADGIECFLSGAALASTVGAMHAVAFSATARDSGGIAVQVRETEQEQALQILQEIESLPRDMDEYDAVPESKRYPHWALTIFAIGLVSTVLSSAVAAATNEVLGIGTGVVLFVVLSLLVFKNRTHQS